MSALNRWWRKLKCDLLSRPYIVRLSGNTMVSGDVWWVCEKGHVATGYLEWFDWDLINDCKIHPCRMCHRCGASVRIHEPVDEVKV